MKIKLLTLIATAVTLQATAQNELYNKGAGLYIAPGGNVFINGSFTNTGAGVNLQNNGTLALTGNFTNDQTLSSYTGALILSGSTPQTLGGTADMLIKKLELNNITGAILDTKLKVDSTVNFLKGIVTASGNTKPLWFTADASHTGASDSSHVHGYVLKEGTGSFTYPVGDSTHYQQVAVAATANADGIQVKYYPVNAGAATFGTTGASATPLLYYNALEYWDISPLSTAAGTVTIHWDEYNNEGITNTSHLVVAHKSGSSWLNEGTQSSTGTITAGSVTSASLSTWSPFSLGSINSLSTLPVNWLNIYGSFNAGKQAVISWQVSERNVTTYQVEKSTDARLFTTISKLNSKGDGDNNYSFTDAHPLTSRTYYRIRQNDIDGRYTHSPIVQLQTTSAISDALSVYPMPFITGFTVSSSKAQKATLVNARGQVLQQIQLNAGTTYINGAGLGTGIYYLTAENGDVQKLVKQ